MFWTVAEDKNGNKKVNGYYHQWGIGRIMPEAAMHCILNCYRRDLYKGDFCESMDYEDAKKAGFLLVFSERYEKGVKLAATVWNSPEMIGEMTINQDNNNGAVVVFAKETEDGMEAHFRVGFLLGEEDAYGSHDGYEFNVEQKELGRAFSRWLAFEEWAALPVNDCCKKPFRDMFRKFMEIYGVKVKD
jgi:hypothetical protein